MPAPRKYHTEEQRRAAILESQRKYRESEKGREARRQRHRTRIIEEPTYRAHRSLAASKYRLTDAGKASVKRYRASHPAYRLLCAARKRAKRLDLPCTIGLEHISVPTVCPVLGIVLRLQPDGVAHDDSPSLDRIVPARGYVPGNIRVISRRANAIKYNATADELRRVLQYVEAASCRG
jgi:hypothetical protein